jgi:hypothetical protein
MKATTVISRHGRATLRPLERERCDFRDNTYNNDSYLDEADMNS